MYIRFTEVKRDGTIAVVVSDNKGFSIRVPILFPPISLISYSDIVYEWHSSVFYFNFLMILFFTKNILILFYRINNNINNTSITMKTVFEMVMMWWMFCYMSYLYEEKMTVVEEVWNPYNDTCLVNI